MGKALFVATVEGTHRAFLLPYARRFRELGWQVDGAAAGISKIAECVRAYDRVFDMVWSRNPFDMKAVLSSVRRIRSIVESGSYDIVHVHTPIAAFVTRYALRRLRRRGRPKVAYTAHGFHFHPYGRPVRNAVFLGLEKMAGRWTDRLIVINEADRDAAIRHRIVPPNRVVLMPGIGIDRKAFDPADVLPERIKAVRDELGLDEGTPLFLMIADFMPDKRHVDAIEAVRGLKGNVQLALAGTGKCFARIEGMVNDLGLQDRARLLGLRSDIPVLIRSSAATVIPSIREGLSRCVMESLCLEVPVIGTDARGVGDLLKKGGGLMVPVRSPEALRAAMEWIIDHPEEARAMGRKGRETTTDYDISRLLELHEGLYAEILAQ